MVERPLWEREWRSIARRFTRPHYLWSCLNCGECVDDTIRFNRAMAKPETEAQRNERIWRRVLDGCEASFVKREALVDVVSEGRL